MLLSETAEDWPALRSLLAAGRVVGPKIHDARIAALALAQGVRVLWTADRDFARFPALRNDHPLVS